MLRIDRSIIQGVRNVEKKQDLYRYLQNAIELEHATIPPYLTAMFSLKPGTNEEISRLIRSIVIEEMLHMTIAANILIAIGGHPQINNPAFVPKYPGTLPMNIGDGLVVPIQKFTKYLVKTVFMVIEEPKDPIPVQTKLAAPQEQEEYGTIGEFYTAIQEKIRELGDGIFVVGPEKQVLTWFSPQRLFPITNVDTAVGAIELIKIEGEGTSASPFESPGEPAHYYRFGEIYYGRKLIETKDGFAYGGEEIPFDESGVYPMIDNPKPEDYRPESEAQRLSQIFTFDYSSLLNALHTCFNGCPGNIDTAMGLMYQLRLDAQNLMMTQLNPDKPETGGPVFRYVTAE